jgi:hypothetical protein
LFLAFNLYISAFTYIGREIKYITKLFKNHSLKISYTTQSSIGKVLSEHKNNYNQNNFANSGVYQLICPNCNKKYIGQTDRPFRVRFQEHFRDYKYGNNKSKFAHHLLDNKHSIGHKESIMDIIHIGNRGKMLNTIEKIYIYKETKIDNQFDDKCTVKPRVIFDTVILKYNDRAHIAL